MSRLTIVGAAFIIVAAGCRQGLPTKLEPGQTVTFRGQITAGTECPMLVVQTGHRFSLSGELGRFRVGDRVCVRGTIAQVSFCMAGEATIAVTSVAPEDSCR